jgi:hypothetical protein
MNTYYKGKISEVKIYNKFFNDFNDIEKNTEDLVLNCDFNLDNFQNNNVTLTNEDIEIIENIVPYRRDSKFECLPHIDEGFINGNWAKGETTARNEKRFVTEMQQGKIDYKIDGLNKISEVIEIDNVDETSYNNTSIINCRTL